MAVALEQLAPAEELRLVPAVTPRFALTTSVPTLDRLLGPFESGRITLIDSGSDYVFHLTSLLCVRAIMEDSDVVFVDGGNSIDPYGIAAIAKRVGLARLEVLPRISVARAFTCYQMATLLNEMLAARVAETEARLVVLSCLPTMFLDEDVPALEAHQLFLRSMRAVRDVTRSRGTITVATNAGLAKLHRRKGIRRVLYESVDRWARFQHHRGGLRISVPELDVEELYRPVPANQATLDDYAYALPRIMDLQEGIEPREVRSSGYLRFGW